MRPRMGNMGLQPRPESNSVRRKMLSRTRYYFDIHGVYESSFPTPQTEEISILKNKQN